MGEAARAAGAPRVRVGRGGGAECGFTGLSGGGGRSGEGGSGVDRVGRGGAGLLGSGWGWVGVGMSGGVGRAPQSAVGVV